MIDNAGLNYFETPLMFINFYRVKQLNYKTLIKTDFNRKYGTW